MSNLYKPEFEGQVESLCKLGASIREIADFFGVTLQTIQNWRAKHSEFDEAIRIGRITADAKVARRLYERATGYSHPDVHISKNKAGQVVVTETTKHYAPETVACIFWLKNRRPDLWRDRMEHTGKDGTDLVPDQSDLEIARRIAFVLHRGTMAVGTEVDDDEESTEAPTTEPATDQPRTH